MNKEKFNTVVLSGGELKGFSELGGLDYLYTNGYMDEVVNYYGTSIGSILCYLLAIGYKPKEMLDWFCTKVNMTGIVFSIRNVLDGSGATSFKFMSDLLINMTMAKLHEFHTLGSLKEETGNRLVVCAYNRTKCETVYFTPETHPSMPCLTVIKMSSSFPNLFPPCHYMNCVWVDGGVSDNFPITEAERDENNIIIGITVTAHPTPVPVGDDQIMVNLDGSSNETELSGFKIPKIIKETYEFSSIVHYELETRKIAACRESTVVVRLKPPYPEITSINIPSLPKLQLYNYGYAATKSNFEDDSASLEKQSNRTTTEPVTTEQRITLKAKTTPPKSIEQNGSDNSEPDFCETKAFEIKYFSPATKTEEIIFITSEEDEKIPNIEVIQEFNNTCISVFDDVVPEINQEQSSVETEQDSESKIERPISPKIVFNSPRAEISNGDLEQDSMKYHIEITNSDLNIGVTDQQDADQDVPEIPVVYEQNSDSESKIRSETRLVSDPEITLDLVSVEPEDLPITPFTD
ncbi:MAG: patatin-like phospholipase family protein [Colwellia sp.]|nr:patatin-like phospholipase family protein [Colwellia sp.]